MKPIAEQKRIIANAWPGPWECDGTELKAGAITLFSSGGGEYPSPPSPTATFIAESRTEWPELLAWAERARDYLLELKDYYDLEMVGDPAELESQTNATLLGLLISDLPTDTVTQSTQPGNVSIKSEDLDK